MQFTNALIIAALATGISAQEPTAIPPAVLSQLPPEAAQIPACSLGCLQSAFQANGITITDLADQCGDKREAITAAAVPCVLKQCSTADALMTQSITNQICQDVANGFGASSASSAPSSAAASSAAPSTAAPSSAAASSAAPADAAPSSSVEEASSSSSACTTATVTEGASSATEAASSATEAPSSAAEAPSSATEAPSSAAEAPSSSVASHTVSTPSSTTSPVEQFTGAATKAQVGMGMVMGAVAAAMAL